MIHDSSAQVPLLWTGGWDSTFRLIELARSGKVIQPYYISNQDRGSLPKELRVMAQLRDEVNRRYKDGLVKEINVCKKKDITIYDDIDRAYRELLKRGWVGDQYVYIASFARMRNISYLELSIERGAPGARQRTNIPCVENTVVDSFGRRVISTRAPGDLAGLFGGFSFPVVTLTKEDMRLKAEEWGALDLLNKTWFCHNPFHGKPCGTCNPCVHTLESGLAYRFSAVSLARYKIKKATMAYPRLQRILSKLQPQ